MLHSIHGLLKPVAPYIGQVTTGCNANDLTNTFASVGTGVKQGMVCSPQIMMDNVPWIEIGIGNWGLSGGLAEQAPSAALSVANMFLEYPPGVRRRVTYGGGSNSASIALNTTGVFDKFYAPPPKGAAFKLYYYQTSASSAVPFHICSGGINSVNGEGFEWAASGITDKSASGTVGITDTTVTSRPVFIRGPTTRRSFGIISDSRGLGIAAAYVLGSNDIGELAPSIGASFANIVVAASGDDANAFNNSHARRMEQLANCSDYIVVDSINALAGGATAAQAETAMQTLTATLGKPNRTWLATLSPVATSDTVTDSTINPKRNTYDAWARGVPAGFAGCFEIADAVEKTRDGGLFKTGYSDDFVHLNVTGNVALLNAKVIQPWRFRPY